MCITASNSTMWNTRRARCLRNGDARIPAVPVGTDHHNRGTHPRTVLCPCAGIAAQADEMVAGALGRRDGLQHPIPAFCRDRSTARHRSDPLSSAVGPDAAPEPSAFRFVLAATLLYAVSLALWFGLVKPANDILATWGRGPIPDNFRGRPVALGNRPHGGDRSQGARLHFALFWPAQGPVRMMASPLNEPRFVAPVGRAVAEAGRTAGDDPS